MEVKYTSMYCMVPLIGSSKQTKPMHGVRSQVVVILRIERGSEGALGSDHVS